MDGPDENCEVETFVVDRNDADLAYACVVAPQTDDVVCCHEIVASATPNLDGPQSRKDQKVVPLADCMVPSCGQKTSFGNFQKPRKTQFDPDLMVSNPDLTNLICSLTNARRLVRTLLNCIFCENQMEIPPHTPLILPQ